MQRGIETATSRTRSGRLLTEQSRALIRIHYEDICFSIIHSYHSALNIGKILFLEHGVTEVVKTLQTLIVYLYAHLTTMNFLKQVNSGELLANNVPMSL